LIFSCQYSSLCAIFPEWEASWGFEVPYSTQEEWDRVIADLMGSTPEQVRRERQEWARAYGEFLRSPQFKELCDKWDTIIADPLWQEKHERALQILHKIQEKYSIPEKPAQHDNQQSPSEVCPKKKVLLAGWVLMWSFIFVSLYSYLQQ
jgi:hypothetical protein